MNKISNLKKCSSFLGDLGQEVKCVHAWKDELPGTKGKFSLIKLLPQWLKELLSLSCKQGSTCCGQIPGVVPAVSPASSYLCQTYLTGHI